MEEVLVAILSMLLVVALIPLYLWRRQQDSRSRDDAEEEGEEQQVLTFRLQLDMYLYTSFFLELVFVTQMKADAFCS